jgi:hypothetical protein
MQLAPPGDGAAPGQLPQLVLGIQNGAQGLMVHQQSGQAAVAPQAWADPTLNRAPSGRMAWTPELHDSEWPAAWHDLRAPRTRPAPPAFFP